VNPELEFGNRFASQILHEGIRGEMTLGEGVLITELTVPPSFLSLPLGELKLPKRFGVTVVAIRKGGSGDVVMPGPESRFEAGDVAVVVAKERAVAKMMEGD
jgi:trk system potassium uptake protein TrkA